MRPDPTDQIVKRLIKRLAQKREKQGLSKNKMAELTGLDRRTIFLVENDQRSPTLRTLLKMAKALDLKLGPVLVELNS